jgi:hypothetical protein
MNITDSEILKLKNNMGFIKNDSTRDIQPPQNEAKKIDLSESAQSKYNNTITFLQH